MWKIGVSLPSHEPAEQILARFVKPIRNSLREHGLGIYSNHLQQGGRESDDQPTEHLLVFEVHDFKLGLRHLRTEFEKLGAPGATTFHNLSDCEPLY